MMTEFRVYFCAPNEQIMGRYEFEAPGDESALRTAELLGVACYDTCSMVDLWQGARRVGMVRDLSRTRLETIAERRQLNLTSHQEAIRDSSWSISRSRELQRRLAEIKVTESPNKEPELAG